MIGPRDSECTHTRNWDQDQQHADVCTRLHVFVAGPTYTRGVAAHADKHTCTCDWSLASWCEHTLSSIRRKRIDTHTSTDTHWGHDATHLHELHTCTQVRVGVCKRVSQDHEMIMIIKIINFIIKEVRGGGLTSN